MVEPAAADAAETVGTVGRLALHAANTAIKQAHLHAQDQEYYERMRDVHETVQEHFMGLIPWIKRIFKLWLVSSLLLVSSIITYGVFYVIVMPGNHTMERLYFDYTCRGETGKVGGTEPVCVASEDGVTSCEKQQKESTTDTRVCSPSATVDLFARQSPWQALQPHVAPNPVTNKQILKSRQHYLMEIALVMPESAVNIDSGMFGVAVDLQSSNGTALASSVRSVRLPHESSWIGFIRKSICLAPLLVGALTESRTVVVEPFRHYVESAEYPLRLVTVQLLARGNAWQDSTPVEVISGEVRIGKELNWLQGILREYFYSCYAMGTLCIFVFQAFFFTVLGKYVEMQREERRRAVEEWEREHAGEEFDPNVHWEEQVPGGEDNGEWDDLPAQGEHGTDRPVTPEHQSGTDPPGSEQRVDGTSSDSAENPPGETATTTTSEEARAERVMTGQTEPYEVFTDHDDPDL